MANVYIVHQPASDVIIACSNILKVTNPATKDQRVSLPVSINFFFLYLFYVKIFTRFM